MAVRLKNRSPPEKNPVLSWRILEVLMDEDKEVLGANGDSGTTSLQCWVYRTSGFEFRSPTRESEVVVGVLAMNTRRKQRKGLSGNLWGFERFIW